MGTRREITKRVQNLSTHQGGVPHVSRAREKKVFKIQIGKLIK
jgi:hypothetical protein